jgi:CheY-specific phosphatase CheX
MDNSIINDLINKCWYDTTGLHIESTNLDELQRHEGLFIASVIFTGKSQGSLTIAMDEALAKKITSNMFEAAIDSVSFDDIKDSIGELANVLAGNMKTDFFGSSELSKPIVMQGSDSLLSIFKIDAIFQKTFVSDKTKELIIQVCRTV